MPGLWLFSRACSAEAIEGLLLNEPGGGGGGSGGEAPSGEEAVALVEGLVQAVMR
jgi:hypothetical protein